MLLVINIKLEIWHKFSLGILSKWYWTRRAIHAFLSKCSKHFNVLLTFVVMVAASYNGASFYIDVFSERYYFEKVLKSKTNSGGERIKGRVGDEGQKKTN